MVSYSRSRNRSKNVSAPGTAQTTSGLGPGPINNGFAGAYQFETMADFVMAPPYVEDHTLNFYKRTAGPVYVSGTDTHPTNPNVFRVWNKYCLLGSYLSTPIQSTTDFDSGYWLTKALANLDPERPFLDLPLFLFEFKDFPRMLRDLGRLKSGAVRASDVPDQILAYNFGWAPLVSDLLNLLGLVKATDDRIKYLKRLESRSPIKRRLTPKGGSKPIDSESLGKFGYNDFFVGECFTYEKFRTRTDKVWFTANASLRDPLPNDPADLRWLSLRAVTGLTANPERLWNFIPWTWLIDYFVNVGDYMAAWGGLTRLKVTRLCLMANIKVEDKIVQRSSKGSALTGNLSLTTERKARSIHLDPTPALRLTPFLNGTQLTNLGALITSKALKR